MDTNTEQKQSIVCQTVTPANELSEEPEAIRLPHPANEDL